MSMYAPERVEAPAVTPSRFGLFSVAVVAEDGPQGWQFGTTWEQTCGIHAFDTLGACQTALEGVITVSVDADGDATITAVGADGPGYAVTWDHDDAVTSGALDGQTHDYAADDGTYDVTVTNPNGQVVASGEVTVTAGQATGPFTLDAVVDKSTATGVDYVESHPFAVYAVTECRLVGRREAEERARAEANLRAGEQYAVEAVLARRLATDSAIQVANFDPQHPVDGLALLEQAMASVTSVAVIHTPRQVGTVLAAHGAIERYGDRLETVQGNLIASGRGYGLGWDPTGETYAYPADGIAWLYATGPVTVRRGTPEVIPAQTRQANTGIVLAERQYTLGWECDVWAVPVYATHAGTAPPEEP